MTGICTPLYPCHGWNCKDCFPKRAFWLREQSLQFARGAAFDQFYFYTFIGFKSVDEAHAYSVMLRAEIKRLKARYNAKKHYFFVMAKHNHSEWHIHLILNRDDLSPCFCHVEPVRDMKIACLYLVKNLEKSRAQNYGGFRRYGASSLLNSNNRKKAYKNRLRLWRTATQYWLKMRYLIMRYILAWQPPTRCQDNHHCERSLERERLNTDTEKSSEFIPHTERPPPIWDTWLIVC